MKINKIEKDGTIYKVYFVPNWFEKLFKIKPKEKEYKESDQHYIITGNSVYVDKTGNELGPFNRIAKAIDKYQKSW